jgi:DNA polymerase-3 subunit epsilon
MFEETFVAIDFETADSGADSACALGLVTVTGGQIVKKQHWLIRPPRSMFLFTYIHGITWEMVKDKPTFKDVWPEVEKTLNGADYLVAHNASFDKRVLEACVSAAGHTPKERRFVCTVQVARKTWQLKPAKLNNCCDFLGIELNHHEALSDAEACARILIAAQKSGRLQETA